MKRQRDIYENFHYYLQFYIIDVLKSCFLNHLVHDSKIVFCHFAHCNYYTMYYTNTIATRFFFPIFYFFCVFFCFCDCAHRYRIGLYCCAMHQFIIHQKKIFPFFKDQTTQGNTNFPIEHKLLCKKKSIKMKIDSWKILVHNIHIHILYSCRKCVLVWNHFTKRRSHADFYFFFSSFILYFCIFIHKSHFEKQKKR